MDEYIKGNEELIGWLEESIRTMLSGKPISAAVVAQNAEGEVLTGYFHADAQTKAIFAHNINADAMLDVVLNNIGMVRDALDELDADDPDETE